MYKVLWDNNSNACGEFEESFETQQDAFDSGNWWVSIMEEADPLGDYSFEVIDEEGDIIED